ncbi:hypothetical protein M758_2G155900 [Ceratodon purpureus]|nr:hypothetical protein M758_2G155900 [Ceratodon purpureus]
MVAMAPALGAVLLQEIDAVNEDLQRSTEAGACEVPVVDLQGVDGERRHLVVQQIRRACEDWGVFQVINHGVPVALLTAMLQQAKEFFQLPVEEKRKLSTTWVNQTTPQPVLLQGYSSKEYGKCFLQWGEQLRHIISPVWERNYELWPTNLPSYRETEEDYIAEQEKFVKHMMELISESLGLNKSAITDVFDGNYQRALLANHYPPSPDPSVSVGITEHSDFSIITVILQDTLGLQAQARDGGWRCVKPIRDALVVNLGDQLQILTNRKYQSGVHRATVDSENKRVSVNTFTNPLDDALVTPIPALLGESQPPLYQGHTYGAYKAAFGARWEKKRAFLKSGSPKNPASF